MRISRSPNLFVCMLLAMLLLAAAGPVRGAQPEFEIKLATLAPENSSLMQVFTAMNEELLKETGGKVGFKMFPGFVLGDEADVLRKLRIGLVHGAVFTMTGLTDIKPDLRAMMVPFLFNNYGEVDYVMGKFEDELKRDMAARGFEVLGWPELGFIYFMSTSPIAGVEDLKGKRVWAEANAPMSKAMIDAVGVSTVAITVPDILVALQTNLLDVVYNSPYYAVVTQWYTQIKYITDLPLSYVGGVLVVDRKVFAKMPAPLQETTRAVCSKYTRRLNERTRKDNSDAMDLILKRGVTRVTPNASQIAGFQNASERAMATMVPKVLPEEAFKKVKAWLAEYRSGTGR